MRDYLTTADILALHQTLVERYGGEHGVRDMGSVEAALFRPQCGYYTNIIEEAAALLESLLINHSFVDGNKRTALAACDVFLLINGQSLDDVSGELYQRVMEWLTSPEERFERICRYLSGIVKP
ncbi:MAG: type II toxin-antitoxin system death-on-curing family toxin [Planctomycetota bacterium]|jgi:death-on-curing protein|nr:type II toxin-antitoxin system death-on-curing family toxin [Planctomycetota bacterium]